jgi:flagellar hook-length control protein FliK
MPTPDPIATPNPTNALRSPGPLVPPEGCVPQGFAELLTALLPVVTPVVDAPPQTVPGVRADGAPKTPKVTAESVNNGRASKSRPLLNEPAVLAEPGSPPPDPPLAAIIPSPPPLPGVQPSNADVTPSGKPADAQVLMVTRPTLARANEPMAVQKEPDRPTPDRASAQPDVSTAAVLPLSAPALPSPLAKTATLSILAPPSEQLVRVLVSVSNTPPGTTHLTLQLRPDALGELNIVIDRTPESPTHIRIEATRPETLALLQRDTTQLQHALERAGVGHDAMTVTFHAAPAVAPVPSTQDSSQTSTQFMGTGQRHQGFDEGRARQAPPPFAAPAIAAGAAPSDNRSARSGIDITA